MVDEYLKVSEAAAALRVSDSTVRRMIVSGELTAVRYGPRLTRVARGEVQAFIVKSVTGGQECERPGAAPRGERVA